MPYLTGEQYLYIIFMSNTPKGMVLTSMSDIPWSMGEGNTVKRKGVWRGVWLKCYDARR